MGKKADYSLSLPTLLERISPNGSSSKTSPGYSVVKTGKISERSFKRWMNSGMVWHGEYWMLNTLEHHSDAEESSLSQVMETEAPLTYFLHIKHLQSLLHRAEAKGRQLPEDLESAIKKQISILSNTPELEESLKRAPKGLDTEETEKLGRLIEEEKPMLYVRRMLPLEYEQLQGFPVGWTESDTEP